jgi:hypothetical protein
LTITTARDVLEESCSTEMLNVLTVVRRKEIA